MDTHIYKENLNKLMEMVLDEAKLVTYISLSKDLCIHVNESKLLLNEVRLHIRNKEPKVALKVNHILSGLTENNSARTLVCVEDDVVELKKEFKVIFFDHIYSISKDVLVVDKVAYLALNKFEDFSLCTGLVKNTLCAKHSTDEIGNFKLNSQNIDVPTPVTVNIKKNKDNHKKSKVEISVVKSEENIPKIEIKKEISSPQKDLSNKKVAYDKKSHISQKGITGFFSKSNGLPNGNKSVETVGPKNKKIESKIKVEKIEVDEKVLIRDELKLNRDSEKNKIVKTNGKTSPLNATKKKAQVGAKRKRVLHVSDSESEEEKNDPFEAESVVNNESEDEIPPTPTINTVKITSGLVNPKKRRKVVDKTYTDDEGYILTKKVEVYESCSENEDDTPPKDNILQEKSVNEVKKTELSPEVKKSQTKNKKKVTPPQKGKQQTLMNFFKKT